MRKRIVGTLLLLVAASLAHAQSPLGVGTAEPSFDTSGFMGGLFNWINTHQQNFYRALTNALKAMREDPWALSGLVGLSFAYGIFHAAGPGHGKAVISNCAVASQYPSSLHFCRVSRPSFSLALPFLPYAVAASR